MIIIGYPFLFSKLLISGGDYTNPFASVVSFTANFWSWCDYNGLGFGCAAINLHATPLWYLALLLQTIKFPVFLSERLLWWVPFFIGGFISIVALFRKIFPNNKFWFFTPIIYLFNTYILMILGGGQIAGIGLGYAITPLLVWLFIRSLEKLTLKRVIFIGFFLTLLVIIDPRIAFIGYLACVLCGIFYFLWKKDFSKKTFFIVFIAIVSPSAIAALMHAYWISPFLIIHQNPLIQLGPAYSTAVSTQFFSFAKFENAIGLLHPNWPENIFGKTYFMMPQFLLLPIMAFGSLLFVSKKKAKQEMQSFYIIFLCLLALTGIFLAKGFQNPFGQIYLWIFSYVPGFELFRDPTKWYLFVALSYSMLIPFTISKLYETILQKNFLIIIVKKLFVVCIASYLVFLIYPLFLHQLTGTFISQQEPKEYRELDSFLNSQPGFFRTLWIPTIGQFSLYSPNHPIMLLNQLWPKLKNPSQLEGYITPIQEMAVKYVIIPYDSNREIFLTDRKYDEKKYLQTIRNIKQIPWLKQKISFGKIIVFEVPNTKNKFFSTGKVNISYKERNPTDYILTLTNVQKNDRIIFSETFDSQWIARQNGYNEISQPFDTILNSFVLLNRGNMQIEISYRPQQWVWVGLSVSICTFFLFTILFFS